LENNYQNEKSPLFYIVERQRVRMGYGMMNKGWDMGYGKWDCPLLSLLGILTLAFGNVQIPDLM
jgi:hypothetical protein